MASPKSAKKKAKKIHIEGVAKINATFNNTIVAFTDPQGNVLAWSTSGACGFRGSRKSTPFAGGQAAREAGQKAQENHGMKRVAVEITGPGPGRENAIREIAGIGLEVTSIKDNTGIPHNGCRPPKRRRV